ncbi:hypothetical protein ACIA6E_29035 [Streptomyces sp. NPDC051815]|uniref:hypothetical protein n=1 Tax=Streptomyces sp. NPDC051815 TaxID=3365674 RepID=UPI0037A1EFF2
MSTPAPDPAADLFAESVAEAAQKLRRGEEAELAEGGGEALVPGRADDALVRPSAVDAFEQAARAPGAGSLEGRSHAGWCSAARAWEHATRDGRGGGAVVVLTLQIALVEAVEAAGAWHRAQEHRAQLPAGRARRKPRAGLAGVAGRPGRGQGGKIGIGRTAEPTRE